MFLAISFDNAFLISKEISPLILLLTELLIFFGKVIELVTYI